MREAPPRPGGTGGPSSGSASNAQYIGKMYSQDVTASHQHHHHHRRNHCHTPLLNTTSKQPQQWVGVSQWEWPAH